MTFYRVTNVRYSKLTNMLYVEVVRPPATNIDDPTDPRELLMVFYDKGLMRVFFRDECWFPTIDGGGHFTLSALRATCR